MCFIRPGADDALKAGERKYGLEVHVKDHPECEGQEGRFRRGRLIASDSEIQGIVYEPVLIT